MIATRAKRHLLLIVLSVLSAPSSLEGQSAPLAEQPTFGSTLTAAELNDLPTADNPFVLADGVQSEVIGDRLWSGGVNVAAAPRFGGFLNSWTQTRIRVGDIDLTDPRAGGTPLLLPATAFWQRLTVRTAAMAVDEKASGLSMVLEPQRPGAAWSRSVEVSFSGSGLASREVSGVPPVDRLQDWQNGVGFFSGPLSTRWGLVAAGSWRSLTHQTAASAVGIDDRVASGFAHLVFAASERDEIRALGWAQAVSTMDTDDRGAHAQGTWEHRTQTGTAWRIFGGFTGRRRSAPVPSFPVVDTLTTDPVSDLFDTGAGTTARWVVGSRFAGANPSALATAGVDLEGAHIRIDPTGIEQIRELVDGAPARTWTVRAGSAPDVRHQTSVAAFANERLNLGRVVLDLGVRLDTVSGAADAADRGIQWTTLLPRAGFEWRVADRGSLALEGAYRRSAYQLPLNVLAIGDPGAPVADVSNWNGRSLGALIARVGPGTGGDASFTRIDPDLRRPTTDEVSLAIASRPFTWLYLQAAGVAKRENSLLGYDNVGLSPSAYTPLEVPDPSYEPGSPQGSPTVTVYDRPVGSYGKDRYLLTNQTGDPASFWGVEVNVRVSTARFFMLLGGTIWTKAVGPAAAVGYLATENDQDVTGSMFVDPNARTLARGQLFQDRSHTGKMAAVYRFPWGVRLGAVARYQDGQPFARLVIVPGMTQGPTVVRAYPNGGTAFTYTGTLDLRLQKTFTRGRSTVSAMVDVYNLANLGNEVSEYVVSGPSFRRPTALQPPRAAIVGARVTF